MTNRVRVDELPFTARRSVVKCGDCYPRNDEYVLCGWHENVVAVVKVTDKIMATPEVEDMPELTPAQHLAHRLRNQANFARSGKWIDVEVLNDAADHIEETDQALRDHRAYKHDDRSVVVADHVDLTLWTVLD